MPRTIALERDPVHQAAMAVVVVHRIVLRAAVVPQGERADLPGEPTGKFRSDLVLEEEIQKRRALLLGHATEARGVREVHVERLASGLGMRAYHRMLGEKLL